jgi:predicted dehydrogenase/nucleoside-diphosphate-sugar epimerase
MRVAIIGAGNNSDYHIRFSRSYPGARIVALVDVDAARAAAVAQEHDIERAFSSTADMLREVRPDVVHVVTPPTTHFAVVREVLESGSHVLVEKPLTLNAADARALYELAERHGVQLCPVHNHLFDPCMRRANELVTGGALGRVINVESYYGLNTQIPAFREYPQPNVLPWLYRLPGGVYQDFLPHALYPVLEYSGAPRALSVMHRPTGVLPQNLPDEIRILIDGERAFGVVTVSFAAKPHLHFVRIYGTKGMVEVDINTMTTTTHAVSSLPKAAQKATYNIADSVQKARSTVANVYRFATGRLKPYQGMMTLIHAFYDSIRSGESPPVRKASALAVLDTMDGIFEQLKYEPLKHEPIVPRPFSQHSRRVLVTGGTGFLGTTVVERFLAAGDTVRVLARKLSRVDHVAALGAEVFWGDVGDIDSFEQAFRGCDLVVHLAAGTSGTEKDSQTATLQGTRNLIELCRRQKPSKLVYVSSCSVYGIADCDPKVPVSETSPLERFPDRRGVYSAAKQEAERLVADFMKSADIPVVVLRPGTIYGPGGELYTPMMGFAAGSLYVVIGRGGFVLPLTYVENVAEAIFRCANSRAADDEVFNVVDPERITKREYMDRVIRRINPTARVLYLPYGALYLVTWLQEVAFSLMGRRPVLTRYRLESSQKRVFYDSAKLARVLDWTPPVALGEALDRLVSGKRPDISIAGPTTAHPAAAEENTVAVN